MPFQLSPGVAVVEKDFSSIVPAVSSSAGAFAGPFSWGPIEDPVRVSSETELVARFGAPKDANFQSFFTAANFLAYTNSLFVSRTDAANLSNAVSTQSGSVTGVTVSEQGVYVQGTDNVTVTFSAPQVVGGATATGTAVRQQYTVDLVTYYRVISVTITNPGSGYTSTPTVTFSAPASGTRALGATTIAVGGIKIKNIAQYLDSYNAGSASVGPFAAKFAGSKGNGLRVVLLDAATWATAPQDIRNLFTGAPSTSAYAASQGITNDEVHIAIFDTPKGQFSGVANSVLEKYTFVSKLADARRTDGSNNYYKSVLNSQSRYVWWMDHPSNVSEPTSFAITSGGSINFVNNLAEADTITITSTTDNFAGLNAFKAFYDAASDKTTRRITVSGAGAVNGSYTVSAVNVTLGVGNTIASYVISVSGLPSSAATVTTATITSAATAAWGQIADDVDTSATTAMSSLSTLVDSLLSGGRDDFGSSPSNIENAYAKFANADEYDISLIPLGNVSPATAAFVVNNVAEVRKDCVVFMSPTTNGDPITSTGSTATDAIIAYRNATNISSSYAVIDSGCKYQYDRYNDAYRWVPLNGDIAGLCARTDYSADPWYSPGGFNRGQIKNVVKLAFNPGQPDRDALYSAGVNPVVNFPGQGVILYGDKTMLARPSAFDRINVRRLFIVLEKAIAVAAKFQLFEFNDGFTRAQFKNLVEPFLRDVQGRRGVTDFRVKCDETNNSGEVIDRNEFVADIFIKPNRSINFITLNFVAARSSVSFEEIGA
jgi:phage tail sheath protein FI